MYSRFPGATQQVDEMDNFFLFKDTSDKWNRNSLEVTNGQQEQRTYEHAARSPTTFESSSECVTSPPLASFSVLLKEGEAFGQEVELDSLCNDITTNLPMQDAMELVSFKLGQHKMQSTLTVSSEPVISAVVQLDASIKPKLPSLGYPCILSSDDDAVSGASTPIENDRGFRKKSREKMRCHEVNNKFDMLVNILGLAGRVRKKNILHEATTTIKGLKRECNQLRHERDRLQLELNKLAAYLQTS